jgi:phosphoribosylformylglycinamidine cyclo-ligase
MSEGFTYKQAGVDIATAEATKREMARSLETADARVLNRLGAFATLFDARFPGYRHPVLVLKSEEPGSKQKLALQHGRVESICQDLVNHLINDIIVMGAAPLSVQDVIVCGKLEKPVVSRLVAGMAQACRDQDCTLTGGETSEQPGVVPDGTYILTASVVGVVEKELIVDGSRIREGDKVLALASNGLHTNGYSLVRALMERQPEILERQVEGESFLDAILKPHRCYFQALRGLFARPALHGMAHITGGGIGGNLNRILPPGLAARIELERLEVLPLFRPIRQVGGVPDEDMLRTFNLGVGMTLVVAPEAAGEICQHLEAQGCRAYPIGQIVSGEQQVEYVGGVRW